MAWGATLSIDVLSEFASEQERVEQLYLAFDRSERPIVFKKDGHAEGYYRERYARQKAAGAQAYRDHLARSRAAYWAKRKPKARDALGRARREIAKRMKDRRTA